MIWPSAKVRDTFVQYFLRHPKLPHVYIPSSSIVPRNDPTLAFCNAGMNQFKDIILGYRRPIHPRITNSQKCLRINDLQLVGADSYHHTFFEMLGNWSFSNYYKKESCAMAWDLLTNVYGLDPQRLYVTYFSGGESLPADRETKEIWEDLGVSPARILPFGKDNFWAMGPIGPCGPSTEIHYDHRGTSNDPTKVNQDFGTVVEIWNLVFMQYNRTEKGSLERLPMAHVVDTGAGLERLTAVMNGKVSNYDTDLFGPIFDVVHKSTRTTRYGGSFESDLDRSYRIFADHMRATTVALSDGILPQTNHKIRRLIQRSLSLTETYFLPKVDSEDQVGDFLEEVFDTISSSLSHVYPEIEKLKDETMDILDNEVHRYISSKKSRTTYHELLPSLLTVDFPALTRIKNDEVDTAKASGIVEGKTAFKWYDSHGVTEEAVEEMCNVLNLKFDRAGFLAEMSKVKKLFRDEITKEISSNEENIFIRKVESLLSFYNPKTSGGVFQPVSETKQDSPIMVEWVVDEDGDPVEEISRDEASYWVLLNKTPFFPGSSSIVSDIGTIELENDCHVSITDVKQLPSGWILHQVINIPEIGFSKKSKVVNFNINNERRCGRGISYDSMYHLKNWFKKSYDVVRFNKEFISWDHIRLEITMMIGELNNQEIRKCEDYIKGMGIPVVVTKRVWKQNGVYEIRIATGHRAEAAIKFGVEVAEIVSDLKEIISTPDLNYAGIRYIIKEHVQHLYDCLNHEDIPLPYDVSVKTEKVLSETERLIERNEVLFETNRITTELASISQTEDSFIVESFETDVEFTSLVKLSRVAGKKPALIVIHSSDGFVQARCTIPEELTTDEFTAEKWMKSFVDELGRGTFQAPKGQDPRLVVNLKRTRIPELDEDLAKGIQEAREYVTRTKARQAASVTDEKSSRQSHQSDQ